MDAIELHDSDFIEWTERQARLLRALAPGAHGLDARNLAEEIEDLGRAEIRETSSLLRQVLVHLIKLAAQPNAPPAGHWIDEVLTFQADAVLACTPGIRQRIDLAPIWRLACNIARRSLAEHRVSVGVLPPTCPLSLSQLLEADFDPKRAAATIRAMIDA